jgi:heme oxygenase (biliverdin-producing, ferredoxin)
MKQRTPSAVPAGFAARLRQATGSVHTRAEKTTFIRGFLRGTASPASYVRLLAALYPVYAVMEEETRRVAAINPVVARFYFPELYRAQSLEQDLRFLAGPDWQRTVPVMAASNAYAARIRQVATHEPVRLVGHIYTRYLGDLSGGQVLARIAGRSLGLAPHAGLDFYEFEAVPDLGAMKTLFRARLDELGYLHTSETNAVIDEAITAFRHNIAIFEHLEGNGFISFFRNLPLPWVRAPRIQIPSWGLPAAAN